MALLNIFRQVPGLYLKLGLAGFIAPSFKFNIYWLFHHWTLCFVCGLYNDAASSSEYKYIASNCGMIVKSLRCTHSC
jgi:hypothetical protein